MVRVRRSWPGSRRGLGAAVLAASLMAASVLVTSPKPAGAVTVNTEADFRTAWAAGTSPIDLGANIILKCTDVGGDGVATTSVAAPIVVDGHGFSLTQTCTTGTNNGVLEQDGTGAVVLQNLTITGGNTAQPAGGGGLAATGGAPVTVTSSTITANTSSNGPGGALAAAGSGGTVMVTDSTISKNEGVGGGGGIKADAVVTVTGSTVSANDAKLASGGGIVSFASLTVTDSTVSANSSFGSGGGLDAQNVSVTNSTVTANTTTTNGGGIFANGPLTLVYATVVQNTFVKGANLAGTGELSAFGSVVALPEGGGTNCDAFPAAASQGFNSSDDSTCGFTASSDHQNAGDPHLGPLANNGGPTLTRSPLVGSPVLDAIPLVSCRADGASGITTDQRGITRPQGPGCDIGAVEVLAPIPSPPAPQ